MLKALSRLTNGCCNRTCIQMDGPGPGIRHIDQIEMREAMEAINVLERFSMRQAEQEIREKMDTMRDAVMRGARLSEIQVGFEGQKVEYQIGFLKVIFDLRLGRFMIMTMT